MLSPLQTATLVTAVVALLMASGGAYFLLHHIPTGRSAEPVGTLPANRSAPTMATPPRVGRHRFDESAEQYRPRTTPALPLDVYATAVSAKLPIPAPEVFTVTPEDLTFLEAVTAQPQTDGPDPFAPPTPSTPDAWFGVPGDETRQLHRVQ